MKDEKTPVAAMKAAVEGIKAPEHPEDNLGQDCSELVQKGLQQRYSGSAVQIQQP